MDLKEKLISYQKLQARLRIYQSKLEFDKNNEKLQKDVSDLKRFINEIDILITSLPEPTRLICIYKYCHGMTWDDIMKTVGVSHNTVGRHLKKGLEMMQEIMGEN